MDSNTPTRPDAERPSPRRRVDIAGAAGWLVGCAILLNEAFLMETDRLYLVSAAALLMGVAGAVPILERLRPPQTGPDEPRKRSLSLFSWHLML